MQRNSQVKTSCQSANVSDSRTFSRNLDSRIAQTPHPSNAQSLSLITCDYNSFERPMGTGVGLSGGGGHSGRKSISLIIVLAVIIPIAVLLAVGLAYGIWRNKHPGISAQKYQADLEQARKVEKQGEELSWEQNNLLEREAERKSRNNVLSFWARKSRR